MSDPFAALLRAEGDEDFAECYEAAVELVAWIEDCEAETRCRLPVCFDNLIHAVNRCEFAIAEHKRRIAAKASDGDTKPAELTPKGRVRR